MLCDPSVNPPEAGGAASWEAEGAWEAASGTVVLAGVKAGPPKLKVGVDAAAADAAGGASAVD